MKFSTILLGLAALFIAFNAAFFSITGLSKLFAGASMAVILMASSLELAKLIAASFLYNYWSKINKFFRVYLTIGVVVLVLITSAGIYGFLISAYQSTAEHLDIMDRQIEVVDLKKNRYEEQLKTYTVEQSQLNGSITELSKGLSNNQIQYIDKESGQLITTTSSATRRVLEGQLNDFKVQRTSVSNKIDVLMDSITSLDLQILDLQVSNDVAAEIGPLKYIAEITGKPMNVVINWFALFIIFVFDPLAVSLIIAFNTALKVDRGEKDKKNLSQGRILYGETEGVSEGTDGVNDDSEFKYDLEYKEEDFNFPPPNEALIRAQKKYKEFSINENEHWNAEKLIDSYQPSKVKIDVLDIEDTDGEWITDQLVDMPNNIETIKRAYEEDLNEDGIVTVDEKRRFYETTGWRNSFKGQPFYLHPWFDWNKYERWVNEKPAVKHWVDNRGGNGTVLQQYKAKLKK